MARNQITAAHCGSPRGSNPCVMSPLAPIGSLKLLLPGSVESKNSEWPASNPRDERFAQSPSKFSSVELGALFSAPHHPPANPDGRESYQEEEGVLIVHLNEQSDINRDINIVVVHLPSGLGDEVKKKTNNNNSKTKQRACSCYGDHSDLSQRRLERCAITQPNKVCFVCLSQDLYFVAPQRRIWHVSQTRASL